MPLFELFRLTKAKLDSSQDRKPSRPTTPDNDLLELVWENGQISMQSQSNKARTRDAGNGTNTISNSVIDETPMSGQMTLIQDDNMVPWLNPSTRYCSDFLPELSGVTVNELSTKTSFRSSNRTSVNQSIVEPTSSKRVESSTRPSSDFNPSSPSPDNQFQTPFLYPRSRITETIGESVSVSASRQQPDPIQHPVSTFSSVKMPEKDPVPLVSKSGLMNFSHFLRPASSTKAAPKNIGGIANAGTDKGSAATCRSPSIFKLLDPDSGSGKKTSHSCQPNVQPSKIHARQLGTKNVDELLAGREPKATQVPFRIAHQDLCGKIGKDSTKRGQDGEKMTEPVVASSSVSSVSSVGRPSDLEITHKRKDLDLDDSEGPSDDGEEESIDAKKASARTNGGSKRSRSAQVHNLSERRRRDRINEKMRALQELIPNCDKVDKASMLEEAIEYLKALQLQVQIMSMGAGYYMPPVMLPTGMQHIHAAPMGMGIGMGYGAPMQDMNVQPPMYRPGAFHGMTMSGIQLGLPMSMPHAQFIPMSMPGGSPVQNLNSAKASSANRN